jgi:hypothetical protein
MQVMHTLHGSQTRYHIALKLRAVGSLHVVLLNASASWRCLGVSRSTADEAAGTKLQCDILLPFASA